MTTERWLKMLRRKLADVDTAALRRTDTELLETAEDMRIEYAMRGLEGFDGITIESNKTSESYGILNSTDPQQLVIMYAVALATLASTYRQRVDRGELGVSWQSGLEAESSISAEKAYKQMLNDLEASLEQLILHYQHKDANARIQ